ncbi:MAG: hypothetical protein CMM08_16660, partial [Rhodospirillaceae bacterium]|nr:hypothetical protein [Rhodospirillaceae bacterium]
MGDKAQTPKEFPDVRLHKLKDYIDAEFAGEHKVKGKIEELRTWRVNALESDFRRFDASLRHGLTTLVGRRSELEKMLDVLNTANSGKAQVIDISGDAGLGKTRLVHEFRQRLAADKVMWLQGNCMSSGQGIPFLPFIEVVRSSFDIADDTRQAAVEHQLRRGLDLLGLESDEGTPYLLNLLG